MLLHKNSTRHPLALVYISSLAFALMGCSAGHSEPKRQIESGIVHGKETNGRDPASRSVVALVAKLPDGQALCTGSIVDDETILTAAHCVDKDASEMRIVFAARVAEATEANTRSADSFVQNPRWHRPTSKGKGDLALVHFGGGLPNGFEPVTLATESSDGVSLNPGQEVLLIGYGVTNGTNHAGAGILRKTKTAVTGSASPTEIETDGRKTSVCFGDSGGPAFVVNGRSLLQWGVASSVTNASCNEASIHTDIRSYEKWIKSASLRLRKHKLSGRGRSAKPADLSEFDEAAE